ncbi:MAG: YjbH domain-containing protein [Prevotella sp.]|nr:YjbH domain-containing protein [Prevotella sp.]
MASVMATDIMDMRKSKYLLLSLTLSLTSTYAQTVIGTPGLMNIPTAEVREGCTFDGGVSLIESELEAVPTYYNNTEARKEFYNTGLYYIYFSPFSFFDITFRETLVKSEKSSGKKGFYQQDRSLSLRVRPIREKEGKWWPSVLIGANDFYSAHGDSYYAAVYGVMTKTIPVKGIGEFAATVGYAKPIHAGVLYDGVFGGASFSPEFAPMVRLMGEYDTRGVNIGIGAHLFRHLNLTCFTREFKGISATISYEYTIRFKR